MTKEQHEKEVARIMPNNAVPMSQSRTVQSRLVLPPDTNNHNSIFGGRVLAYIDEIAAITAMKHAKGLVVTASIDSVDFYPRTCRRYS